MLPGGGGSEKGEGIKIKIKIKKFWEKSQRRKVEEGR